MQNVHMLHDFLKRKTMTMIAILSSVMVLGVMHVIPLDQDDNNASFILRLIKFGCVSH